MIKALSKGLWLNISMENFQIRAEQMRTLVRAYPSMIVAIMVMAPLQANFVLSLPINRRRVFIALLI